jgi:hypothetical protein
MFSPECELSGLFDVALKMSAAVVQTFVGNRVRVVSTMNGPGNSVSAISFDQRRHFLINRYANPHLSLSKSR